VRGIFALCGALLPTTTTARGAGRDPAGNLSGRPKQLAKDAEAIERIRALWADPSITIAEISRQVDRPRQTVEALIRRLLDRGELPPHAAPGHIADEGA